MAGIFSKPKAPTVIEQKTMPTPDAVEIKRKKKKDISKIMSESGRASTFLSAGQGLGG